MALKDKREDRMQLIEQIEEWNANRLDLFELSLPDENLEFHGVMRFYYQDAGQRVSTKCIRVSSTATTKDVLDILIDKFRPDMRMLSLPSYALYEVHVTGDERRLRDMENPLTIQMNWGKDDREGRFLLKSIDQLTVPIHTQSGAKENVPSESGFKRKLSKREKKEKKKKEKEAKIRGKENETPMDNSISKQLYKELPETSFTRSISNPEAVMKKRRELKLQRKLEEIQAQDDNGGTLKIYGRTLNKDVPYKTLLLSTADTVAYVIKETLSKYGLEREDPENFVLIQEFFDPTSQRKYNHIMGDAENPLMIISQYPSESILFEVRRRTPDMPPKSAPRNNQHHYQQQVHQTPQPKLPFLREVESDGRELKKGRDFLVKEGMTEMGSSKPQQPVENYIRLWGADVLPIHCVIMYSEQVASVTPQLSNADVYIDNVRIHKTEMLRHNAILRVGKHNFFRFINPLEIEEANNLQVAETSMTGHAHSYINQKQMSPESHISPIYNKQYSADPTPPPKYNQLSPENQGHPLFQKHSPDNQTGMTQSQNSVSDGLHIKKQIAPNNNPVPYSSINQTNLPASLSYAEQYEDDFLRLVINSVQPNEVNFKLAPTYILYMAARYRLSPEFRPDMDPSEKANQLSHFLLKVAGLLNRAVQSNKNNTPALAFWMANSSELLHFVKHDRDIANCAMRAQGNIEDAVQLAFRQLVQCIELELDRPLVSFFDSSDDIQSGEMDKPQVAHVLQLLTSTMSLLRRCRVNAALTIQLFSQLFHFINHSLFNKLVNVPKFCAREWGEKLRHRLALVEKWAEKQGLELAAECHLGRISQAAYLLSAPKYGPQDIAQISSACFKLNSLQIQTLLTQYGCAPGEPPVSQQFITNLVRIAQNTADVHIRDEGRKLQINEETELHLPFLLPDDGYTCQLLRAVPNGLEDLILPLINEGIAKISVHNPNPELWTLNLTSEPLPTEAHQVIQHSPQEQHQSPGVENDQRIAPYQNYQEGPEIEIMLINKIDKSLGLSIVAAQGENQPTRGIYIKSVVDNGAADRDGRLQAGDQLLEVDGQSLVGLMQEKAAQLMTKTGATVQLKVAKQAAAYHGLAALLSQPSPIMQRPAPPKQPHSDNVIHQRIQDQHQAHSVSILPQASIHPVSSPDRFSRAATRSKSTSQLDQSEPAQLRFDTPSNMRNQIHKSNEAEIPTRHVPSPDTRVAEWQKRNEQYERQHYPDDVPIEYKRTQQPHFYDPTAHQKQPQSAPRSQKVLPPRSIDIPANAPSRLNQLGDMKSPSEIRHQQDTILSPNAKLYGDYKQTEPNRTSYAYESENPANRPMYGAQSAEMVSPQPKVSENQSVLESGMMYKMPATRSLNNLTNPLPREPDIPKIQTDPRKQQPHFYKHYDIQNEPLYKQLPAHERREQRDRTKPTVNQVDLHTRDMYKPQNEDSQQPIYSTVNKARSNQPSNAYNRWSPENFPPPPTEARPPSPDEELPPPPPPPQEYEQLMLNERQKQEIPKKVEDNYQNIPVSRYSHTGPQPQNKPRPPPTATKPKLTDNEKQRILKEFDKRVNEEKYNRSEPDSDTDMRETAAGRAAIVRMLSDQVDSQNARFAREKQQEDIDRIRLEEESYERSRRRLESLEEDLERQRQQDQKRFEKRDRERADYYQKQHNLMSEGPHYEYRPRHPSEHERPPERPNSTYSNLPMPPQRHASYEFSNQRISSSSSMGHVPQAYEPPLSNRSSSVSALRQLPETGGKKSVSFNSNLTTEIAESSKRFVTTPTEVDAKPQFSSAVDGIFAASMGSGNAYPGNQSPKRPEETREKNFVTSPSTPGVVGSQEIYRDPRERLMANKPRKVTPGTGGPERLSFRDKQKMFASEIGENTPPDRVKTSRMQYQLERNGLNY